jgi:heat shock protein HtpX
VERVNEAHLRDLDQIVGRNRRRIVVLVVVAALNYTFVLTIFSWALVWGSVFKFNEDADISGDLQLYSSIALGAVGASAVVGSKLWRSRSRTVAALRAVDIEPGKIPMIDNLLSALALGAGTHPVRAALLADEAPNALAVGLSPRDTSIVVTSGLLEKCTRHEIEAVLAVEMCSVRRLDTALQTVGLACAQSTIAHHHSLREDWKDPRNWIFVAVTWPSMVIAELIRAAAFHLADFGADAMALRITRNPAGLDQALARLEQDQSVVKLLGPATAPLWFEPVPHHDPERAREFRRFAESPTLADRRARLPHVRS